jgi:translation initiation factor 2 subunit 1
MKKSGKPRQGELVVCKITKIHPNSAFAQLIEYDLTGMIHVSEVAKKWVRNIREFVKENQYVVCRIMRLEDHTISLSIKRVHREDSSRKLNEFKRENRAEKLLEMAGKGMKKSLDQVYDEVGYKLQDEFGSLTKALETALKSPELLGKKGVPKAWADAMIEIAKKSYTEKVYTVRGILKLVCYGPDGVNTIRKILSGKKGVDIRFVTASKYEILGKGKNYKETEARVKEACEAIVKEVEGSKGEGTYELVE